MSTLPLFEEPAPELAARLAGPLSGLAAEGIYVGASSWKYEGWIGQVYTRERYFVRGRFSQKKFQAECLNEYAKTFPIVCGDFSFYQFPAQAYWQRLFASAPPELLYAFKVPEDITVKRFPGHARYGARAGIDNPAFLNATLFREAFLGPLEPYRKQIAALIFEFGAFPRDGFEGEPAFLDQLDGFLRELPGGWRYSVEVRNTEFLNSQYFHRLGERGVAHVFNAWTRMPELETQIRMAGAFTTDFTVVRALLRQGRPYEDAVAKFSPYLRVQEPNPGARSAIKNLIQRSRRQKQMAFVFVNNRLEGNAPETIASLLED
jgi:uncharacterized protein YecE (DUF72 family)